MSYIADANPVRSAPFSQWIRIGLGMVANS
jgi:hypothetical protein